MIAAAAAIAVAVAVGCTEDRTEILVVVDSDLAVPSQLDEVNVRVTGPDSDTKSAVARLGPGEEPLPRTVGLVHEDGPLGPVQILVTGGQGGAPTVERRAILSFVEGRTLLLRMELLASCQGMTCGPDMTCVDGSCRSAEIDPDTLPEYDGTIPGIDGGAEPTDSGPGVDAGPGTDAGPETDAGCVPATEECNGEDDDCDGMVDEGFDFDTDPRNCGGCGNACLPPNRDCCAGTCGRC